MENKQKQTAVEWLENAIDKYIAYVEGSHKAEPFTLTQLSEAVQQAKEMHKEETTITENTSDGYHTFKVLYDIRKAYNVALFNEWGKYDIPYYNVHKSRKHHDGEYPFGKDNWFIVCAMLPTGQISNHYPIEDWDLFKIPATDKALFPFDGHTTEDVIQRLLSI